MSGNLLMNPSQPSACHPTSPQRDMKRYKSYPVTHFSRWRKWVQQLTLILLIAPYILLKYRPLIYGRRNVPATGPFIVAANHISLLDPPLIAIAIRYPVAFMAKQELFKNLLVSEFYRLQGCFALDRDNPDSATLKTALNVLKSPAKWALGIFPEGTRSLTGEVLPLKKGIGSLAQKTKTPILPVGVCKTAQGRLMVTIGELITDVSDANKIQDKVYETLLHLTDPSWVRK